jgi:hypothetical protein
VTEPPPTRPEGEPPGLAEQLARTAADLRVLGEQLGAIPHAEPKTMTLRRARITFAFVVAIAALIGWFVWANWHSLLAAFAPLIWVAGHGYRMRRSTRTRNDASP